MHRNLTAAALIAGALLALTACAGTQHSDVSQPATPTVQTPGTDVNQVPGMPTGARRAALLASITGVNSRLAANETQAMIAAIKQCATLATGAPDPDHLAAQRFSYAGVHLTDAEGAQIDAGLRKSLCPN